MHPQVRVGGVPQRRDEHTHVGEADESRLAAADAERLEHVPAEGQQVAAAPLVAADGRDQLGVVVARRVVNAEAQQPAVHARAERDAAARLAVRECVLTHVEEYATEHLRRGRVRGSWEEGGRGGLKGGWE